MRSRLLPFLFAGLLLTSCGENSTTEPTDEISSSSSSESIVVETHNVSFIGTIRPAGISIYMEGTHRLELGDGRFILLSSDTVDLNGYVGEEAEVTGSIRPTVEEGGTIMSVEQIRLTESNSSSSEASHSSLASSASSLVPVATSSAAASVAPVSSAPSSKPSSVSSAAAASVDVSAQVTAMAKQKLDTANWTQAYCAPPTIGFCIPVHRNWYFKSFGMASESLWHVEVGAQTLENISDGPIAVDLLGGSVSTANATDGAIRDDGKTVHGYKEWTKDRHIEISAPSALKAVVEYMTQHLSAMEEQAGT